MVSNNSKEISKLQETVSNYIQKAETVQISKLTMEKLYQDGFVLIARSLNSITEAEYHYDQKFEWPIIPNNEKEKRNKLAYCEYLSRFLEKLKCLQVKMSIESPQLNTVVGVDPHKLNGEADLYVMPRESGLISRTSLTMVLELKPNEITSNNLAQAVGYVIAANSLFDQPGRPSPVGVLSDLMDQWHLIWIGEEGEVCYASTEKGADGDVKSLTRLTALFHIRKHLERYNQMICDEGTNIMKRKSEGFNWAFDGISAGFLKKQKVLEAEDNLRDLLETDEEIAAYDMKKRIQQTPLFQFAPSAESQSYSAESQSSQSYFS
jgi:hypothetical protein